MQIILNKRGTSIAIKNGCFYIKNKDEESLIAVNKIKSIVLNAATSLTYEVVNVAIQENIDIIFVDRKGFPIGRIWSHHFGSIATIRKNQLAFSQNVDGVKFIQNILIEKINNQIVVIKLLEILTAKTLHDKKNEILKFYQIIEKLEKHKTLNYSETFATFRGLEGSAGKLYFSILNQVLPHKYRFTKRSQHPAFDMFNCLLNYAYGMLYSIIESSLLKVGIDPYIGIMHRDEYNRPVFVYDFIELFRHWADYVVCHLCLQDIIETEFFEIEENTFWLNKHGKSILIQSFNDYFNEIISIEGLSRSRIVHIELRAQKTATLLKSYSPLINN